MLSQSFVSRFKMVLGVLVAGFMLSACQGMVDHYIESWWNKNGSDHVEKAIDEIVRKKRAMAQREEEPPLSERLKKRVDVETKGSPSKGPENAAITMVEFSDFQCPFCKRVNPTVDQLMNDYKDKIRLVFRFNPLPFHEQAMTAAKAAYAAMKQGKFWQMYDKLFGDQQAWSFKREETAKAEAVMKGYAKELKLDVKKFEKDIKDPATEKAIENDENFARANGAGGTPSFFINGVLLVGAQPIDRFKEIVDALLKEKGGNPPAPPAAPAQPTTKK